MKKINSQMDQYKKDSSQQRWLRRFSDLVCHKLTNGDFSEEEAVSFLESARQQILERYPNKEKHYSEIYEQRFKRILLKKGITLSLSLQDRSRN